MLNYTNHTGNTSDNNTNSIQHSKDPRQIVPGQNKEIVNEEEQNHVVNDQSVDEHIQRVNTESTPSGGVTFNHSAAGGDGTPVTNQEDNSTSEIEPDTNSEQVMD